jgi:SAM-dependent MidA family methyltransferase
VGVVAAGELHAAAGEGRSAGQDAPPAAQDVTSPLKQKILDLIRAKGPISIAEYMSLSLYDPEHGFYMTRDPFGVKGAFTTAPEISQMFGELIGAFFVQAWEDRGRPERFHFVELGPGRGTLMADMLRAARARPGFEKAAQITLVEISPVLKAIQQKTLAGHNVRWGASLDEVPNDAPLFLIANEFFDALPIRQYVKANDGWHERMIGANGDNLVFALAPDAMALDVPVAPEGSVLETSSTSHAIVAEIARRIGVREGVALIVDYGHMESGFGDTFQAVRSHAFASPLDAPGEADLTAHVDFAALVNAVVAAEGYVFGPEFLGVFLNEIGIPRRAERLKNASPNAASDIDAALRRLTDPSEMGKLFKVMAICEDAAPGVEGFPCSS